MAALPPLLALLAANTTVGVGKGSMSGTELRKGSASLLRHCCWFAAHRRPPTRCRRNATRLFGPPHTRGHAPAMPPYQIAGRHSLLYEVFLAHLKACLRHHLVALPQGQPNKTAHLARSVAHYPPTSCRGNGSLFYLYESPYNLHTPSSTFQPARLACRAVEPTTRSKNADPLRTGAVRPR